MEVVVESLQWRHLVRYRAYLRGTTLVGFSLGRKYYIVIDFFFKRFYHNNIWQVKQPNLRVVSPALATNVRLG